MEIDKYIAKGYRKVPNTELYINKHGSGILNKKKVSRTKGSGNDRYFTITLGDGKDILLHRALAMAFIPTDGDYSKLEVNHIDGNKLNNEIGNLEWVTPSENLIHAFETGLRTDNRQVEVLDLITKNTEVFYSISHAGRSFSRSPSTMLHYLRGNREHPYLGRYAVRYLDEPYKNLDTLQIGDYGRTSLKPIVGIEKGKITVYESWKDISISRPKSIAEGLDRKIMDGDKTPLVLNNKVYFYLHMYDDEVDLSKNVRLKEMGNRSKTSVRRKPIPIKVTDDRNGVIKEYVSVREFADEVGVKFQTIAKSIYLKGKWRNFKIEYTEIE